MASGPPFSTFGATRRIDLDPNQRPPTFDELATCYTTGIIAGAPAKVVADGRLVIDIDMAATPLSAAIAMTWRKSSATSWRMPVSGERASGCRQLDSAKDVVLSIDDDGPGLPPALAGEAARRGKRLNDNSPGWDLDLSIVSDLVQVNCGELTFSKSHLGELSVVVRIPHAEA